jgi:hypothetical protein
MASCYPTEAGPGKEQSAMIRMLSLPVLLASIGLASIGFGQPPKKRHAHPVVSWTGVVEDGSLKGKIQANVITDPANFKNLWKALNKKDDCPEVDFERAFVVVETSTDRILAIRFEVDGQGHMTEGAGQAAALKGGGFSYFAGVFLREGVQSYKGKAIKAGR